MPLSDAELRAIQGRAIPIGVEHGANAARSGGDVPQVDPADYHTEAGRAWAEQYNSSAQDGWNFAQADMGRDDAARDGARAGWSNEPGVVPDFSSL